MKTITPVAIVFAFWCADKKCAGFNGDPIPNSDGFLWYQIPAFLTCPKCGRKFPVSRRVSA